jgi:hypothetical protein
MIDFNQISGIQPGMPLLKPKTEPTRLRLFF